MSPDSIRRRERGNRGSVALAMVLSLVVAALCVFLLVLDRGAGSPGDRSRVLTLYCAAGLRAPVEAAAAAYLDEFGVEVQLHYGGSGTLLAQLEVAKQGDLYLAGDDSYIDTAHARGLVQERIDLARMRPLIAVRAGNPHGIRSIEDFARADHVLGLADPEAAAIGRAGRKLLQQSGDWPSIEAVVDVTKPTVGELAADLVLGSIDASILWDATAGQYPEIEGIPVPAWADEERDVTLGVLSSSEHPTEALRFARYLGARDRGLVHFESNGFRVVEGDAWKETPEVLIHSGAMLHPAIDDLVTAFEDREGVRVQRVYNGCGILVAQIKAGTRPDAYLACDQSFLEQVADRFGPGVRLSSNDLVLAVAKGNPLGLRGAKDLLREGVRIGLADRDKSALGALSAQWLEQQGIQVESQLGPRIEVWSATGDALVNQAATGSLDAVLVYRSNATHLRDRLDLVDLEGGQGLAIQPFAIAHGSEHAALLARLLDALTGEDARIAFESLGFTFLAPEEG